jgi:hypothetical protein
VDVELRQEAASIHLLRPRRDEEVHQSRDVRQNQGEEVRQSQAVRRVLEDHRAASWSGAWGGGPQVHPEMAAGCIQGRRSWVHRRGGRDRRLVFRAESRRPVAGGRSRWEAEPASQVEAAAPSTPDAVRSEA